jgi:hypothetical protein
MLDALLSHFSFEIVQSFPAPLKLSYNYRTAYILPRNETQSYLKRWRKQQGRLLSRILSSKDYHKTLSPKILLAIWDIINAINYSHQTLAQVQQQADQTSEVITQIPNSPLIRPRRQFIEIHTRVSLSPSNPTSQTPHITFQTRISRA